MNTHYLGTSIYTSVVYGFRILVSRTSVGKPTRSMDANAETLLHYNTQKPCKGIETGTTLLLVSLVYVQSIAPYSSKRLTVQIGTLSHSDGDRQLQEQNHNSKHSSETIEEAPGLHQVSRRAAYAARPWRKRPLSTSALVLIGQVCMQC